jgi:uncharacterized damage-inducible protein DinB
MASVAAAAPKLEGVRTHLEIEMTVDQSLVQSIFDGWHTYQRALTEAIAPLDSDQLAIRPDPKLRSVGQISAHIIGARARWFYLLMGEGGSEFEAFGKWDRRGAKPRTAAELGKGLEATWQGMHDAIARWTPDQWNETWPGEDDTEPEVITRQWVIWHLIEHDLHHGGEISITLGVHMVKGLRL